MNNIEILQAYRQEKEDTFKQVKEWINAKFESIGNDGDDAVRWASLDNVFHEEAWHDFFDISVFGKVECQLHGNDLYDNEVWHTVIYSPKLDIYFGLSGWYSSYDGTDYDLELKLYYPQKVLMTEWKDVIELTNKND